jgi:multiple sugar transport system permease protein
MNYLLTPLRDYNWFQQLLTWLDLTFPIEWLGRVHTIKPTLAMLTIWRWTGWNMVLYLAGLQSIPHEIYESAKVDGASNWDLFWRISLPLLRPMMTFAVTMSVIGSMQAFDEPMVILGTGGGVGRAGKTTVLYLYQTSFEWMDFGTGAAMSYLLFFLIIVFSVINFRFFRRER